MNFSKLKLLGAFCLIALSGCVATVKVISPETVAEIRAQEVDSVARLSLEGQAYYEADPFKKSGPQYCSIAINLAYRGEFRQAIQEASKALFLGEQYGNEYVLGLAKRDIALTYSLAGKLKRAETFAEQALDHMSRVYRTSYKGQQRLLRARALTYKVRGDIRLRLGYPDKAIADFEAALKDASDSTLRRSWIPRIKASLGNAYLAKGETVAAKRLFQELRETVSLEVRPLIDRGLADIALREKRYGDAAILFERLATDYADVAYHRIWALDGLARARVQIGDPDSAINAYLEAIASAEKMRAIFRSEEFKAGFFADIQNIFDRAVTLLMDHKRTEEALEVSERSRARAFLDMVRDRVVSAHGDQAFTDSAGKVYSLAALKKLVPQGFALVEFHVMPERTYAWTIRSSGIQATTIDIGQERLADLVDDYWATIASRLPQSSRSGRQLHQLLVEPLGLDENEGVIIIPHGVLHYLPFHALPGPKGYLIESRVVSYAPSISVLANLLENEDPGKESLIAFGNPDLGLPVFDLPNAQKEVENIKTLFPQTQTFFRKNATKSNLLSKAPGKNVVHIAAHAEIDQLDPLHSVIRMARTKEGPGDIKAYEIYGINLTKTKLVILSACDTAFGRVSRGDEIWGFTRTFLSAGARALIVSLWPVEDRATMQLMSQFYDEWRNKPMAQSLRAAQLKLLRDDKTSHPFYWAPFILVGDWR